MFKNISSLTDLEGANVADLLEKSKIYFGNNEQTSSIDMILEWEEELYCCWLKSLSIYTQHRP